MHSHYPDRFHELRSELLKVRLQKSEAIRTIDFEAACDLRGEEKRIIAEMDAINEAELKAQKIVAQK